MDRLADPVVLGLVVALVGLTLVNWYGAATLHMKTYYSTKPLVMMVLIALFLYLRPGNPHEAPFLLGLVFSLGGDIALIPKSTRWFLVGLVLFLFAHIFYIWGFNQVHADLGISLIFIGLAGLLLFQLLRLIRVWMGRKPELKRMRNAFTAYAIFLAAMTVSALLCFLRPGWSFTAALHAAVGGLLFFVSDSLLALDRMGKRIPRARFMVITTYHLAQFLIVAAALGMP